MKNKQTEDGKQLDCFKPGNPAYFNSDKVLDIEYLLAKVLRNSHLRDRIIASVCAIEGCSYATEKQLCDIEDEHELAKVLITGVIPKKNPAQGTVCFSAVAQSYFYQGHQHCYQ